MEKGEKRKKGESAGAAGAGTPAAKAEDIFRITASEEHDFKEIQKIMEKRPTADGGFELWINAASAPKLTKAMVRAFGWTVRRPMP